MRTNKLVLVVAFAALLILLGLWVHSLQAAPLVEAASPLLAAPRATRQGAWLDSAASTLDGTEPLVVVPPRLIAQTWVVTSTADSGPGTLRACLQSAQAGDVINFDPAVFPPGNPATIAVTSGPLPAILQGDLTIDATNAGVILDGSALSSGNGLNINSDGNVVQGLQILSFPENGVRLFYQADDNLIGGINSSPGGACSGQCNVISGNGWTRVNRNNSGVLIYGAGNTVSGNYIGTDASGTEAVPNGNGVLLYSGIGNNVIGGQVDGSGNLISGNDMYDGVLIFYSNDNQIVGNLIGTDASGSSRLPNAAAFGIYWDSKRNVVEDNVITGDFFGIQIAGSEARDNVISDNWIGTNADGDDLGNAWGGIEFTSGTGTNTIGPGNAIRYNQGPGIALNFGAHDNLVTANDICQNGQGGLNVWLSDTLRNTLRQNSIYGNGGPGIELVEGGNAELTAPIITSLDLGYGTASGTACPDCSVELFSDDEDEGRCYEGTATAGVGGAWSFAKGSPLTGAHLTATATDPEGNTSEFSAVSDIAVVDATPNGEETVGQPTGIRAELLNPGGRLEDQVPVACTIEDPSGTTVYNQTALSGPIPAGTWALVELLAWTPAVAGDHTLTCQSLLPVDQEPGNDAFSQIVTAVAADIPDVWTRDNDDDTGDVPSGSPWWVSPDLWVRNQPDGGLVYQDPIAFQDNTVYVRLRNRGTAPASGTVGVYWDRSRVGWPCKVEAPNVGTIGFDDLAPGEVRIVSLTWTPEKPGHFGLFTVIDADGDPPDWDQPCSPHRPRYDNNISWKNVVVFLNPLKSLAGASEATQAEAQVVNLYDRPKDVDVVIDRLTFPSAGSASLFLTPELFDRWWAYDGRWFEGVQVVTVTKEIRLTGDVTGTIGALPMEAAEVVTATLRFDAIPGGAFDLGLEERIEGLVVGGIAYQWQNPDLIPPQVVSTSPADGETEVELDAPVVITFSEPIGPLTLDLSLAPDPGGWSLAWNEAGTMLTATHVGFALETTYLATVTANDAWGNAMAEPLTWSFTTRAPVYRIYLPVVVRAYP